MYVSPSSGGSWEFHRTIGFADLKHVEGQHVPAVSTWARLAGQGAGQLSLLKTPKGESQPNYQ